MNKNSKSDNAYVDLAAERLAGLFIEQAKYNRSHKDSKSPQIPQHIEQIKLHLRYSWDPVLVDGTNEYHYPMAVSRLMKQKYNKPVIYKWNVYKHSPNDQRRDRESRKKDHPSKDGTDRYACRRVRYQCTPSLRVRFYSNR